MRAALVLVLLVGCVVETFTDGEAGTVYECRSDDGTELELCAVIDAEQLGVEIGGTCARTDRTWPRLTNALGNGCVYGCYPHTGCNAKSGCYCPHGEE